MEAHLPAFKEKIPHLEVVTELVRGQHPNLKGIYSKILVTFIFHFNLWILWNGRDITYGSGITALGTWIGIKKTLQGYNVA